jgi:hypothetical protein
MAVERTKAGVCAKKGRRAAASPVPTIKEETKRAKGN